MIMSIDSNLLVLQRKQFFCKNRIYYLNSAVRDLNTGDIYGSEFYAAAPFDNDFAFDNLIANSKLFTK